MSLDNKPTYVVGMGKTGVSVANFLQEKSEPFVLVDSNPDLISNQVINSFDCRAKLFGPFNDKVAKLFLDAKQLVVSPGISLAEPVFDLAKTNNIPIIGDVEFFGQYINSLPIESQPVIASITGSNGKSTVASLLAYMAELAKVNVALGGNIGVGVFDLISKEAKLLVLELSSFQLETCKSLKSEVVSLLNLSPDHLDRYENYQAYCEAKHHIYNQAEVAVVNRHDEKSWPSIKQYPNLRIISFGLDSPKDGQLGISIIDKQTYICFGESVLLPTKDLKILGTHNQLNAMAALGMGFALGIQWEPMLLALQNFQGLDHRCQCIKDEGGVKWINDSKGTNVGATIAALESLYESIDGKIILIVGGVGKSQDFAPLVQVVQNTVKKVLTIGQDGKQIANEIGNLSSVDSFDKLDDAVVVAKKYAEPGDVVLLSPACASFDQYPNYLERGKHFIQLVNQAFGR